MKVDRACAYNPILITLETKKEKDDLIAGLRVAIYEAETDKERDFIISLREKLSDEKFDLL